MFTCLPFISVDNLKLLPRKISVSGMSDVSQVSVRNIREIFSENASVSNACLLSREEIDCQFTRS